jgi:hypothetical protein
MKDEKVFEKRAYIPPSPTAEKRAVSISPHSWPPSAKKPPLSLRFLEE